MGKVCIGIDLGGTFIKFGTLDEQRQASEVFQLPTPSSQDGIDAVIDQMVAGARQAMERTGVGKEDVVGVGIGSPGPLSMSEGIVYDSPNIPGMHNVPLRDRVSEALGIPAALENDANAAALGEFLCGAGRQCRDMVLLTLGTGLGGGLIIDGRVHHGSHEIGAELGHMIIVPDGRLCGCGQRGCIEQYCSATFMSRAAERKLREHARNSSLEDVLYEKGELTSKDINEARAAGDAFAAEVWDEMARYLAIGCVNFARIFDPDRIVLAGGMAAA
ncbi:MAG: ROK family protein, partial [Planctomycetes bacterium]|nr:ROK family protein [Planctomycetota bacterium]